MSPCSVLIIYLVIIFLISLFYFREEEFGYRFFASTIFAIFLTMPLIIVFLFFTYEYIKYEKVIEVGSCNSEGNCSVKTSSGKYFSMLPMHGDSVVVERKLRWKWDKEEEGK